MSAGSLEELGLGDQKAQLVAAAKVPPGLITHQRLFLCACLSWFPVVLSCMLT